MARAPAPAPAADMTDDTDTGTDTGADTGTDMGAMDEIADQSGTVLVTITKGTDGGYVVYAGDEPDEDEAAEGEGGEGAAPGAAGAMGATGAAPEGQQVDSIGQALKAAMDILQESESSAGETGTSEDQFAGGFNAEQSPTPAMTPPGRRGGLKYPPAKAG